jgi:hypothetical protein
LNGAFYSCPSAAAVSRCVGFDVVSCFQSCAMGDFGCAERCNQMAASATPDPSLCARNASSDGMCQSAGTSGGTSGGTTTSCKEWATGASCGYDSQCGSGNHCAGGKCYANTAGAPCGYDSQCGSGNHCTGGCCYWNSWGQPCGYNSQCDSGNCSGGKCQ